MSILDVESLCTDGLKRAADNHPLVPQHDCRIGSFRWLISGKSGVGKTNCLVSALLQNQIKFEHIYLFVADPTQSKYKLLLQYLNTLQQELGCGPLYTIGTSSKQIVPLSDVDSSRINVAVFDDLLTEKNQSVIADYFIKGRHSNVSSVYISQSYIDTPKIIRKNCDYFSIFSASSSTEFNTLCSAQNLGFDKVEFKKMFDLAARDNNFLFIDRKTTLDILRIRKNFDQVWDGEKFSKIK